MATIHPNISVLNTLGQSIWYDNLSRDVLNSGELKKLLDSGVSGLTSNPTIFKQAIADTNNYDSDIAALAKKGLTDSAICEELMVNDVAKAADLLLPTYKATKGADGYASIEVSPFLARDTKSTVDEANRLWKKLSRPNIMIKVPATKEGLPAIRELLESAINVNITLIFSTPVYEEVANAYIGALDARKKKGQPVGGIASVASFFVSRVDTICEKFVDDLIAKKSATAETKSQFEGKAGIANSKLAYERFEQLFYSDRFKELKAAGAMYQRPLWASTGTKNPKFDPLLYVFELAGKHTVNTLPPKTVKTLIEKETQIEGKLHKNLGEAKSLISKINDAGLPFEQLLIKLQVEGVDSFSTSYKDLLTSVSDKMKKVG